MSLARLGAAALGAVTVVATLATGTVAAHADHEKEPEVNVVAGTRGPDRLTGTKGEDVFRPHGGHDRVFGYRGMDLINPSDGNDVYRGQAGSDGMDGGKGRDRLYGGSGFDVLLGGRGADKLRSGPSGDLVFAGRGADLTAVGRGADFVLVFGDGRRDEVRCGKGEDTVVTGDRGQERLDRLTGCEEVMTVDELFSGSGATSRLLDAAVAGAFGPEIRAEIDAELTAASR